jgi:hypothetical protein
MQHPQRQQHYRVELTLENGKKKVVDVKAGDHSVAENRAMKRNPGAVSAIAVKS